MKVVYHPRFLEVYSSDPAVSPGRLEQDSSYLVLAVSAGFDHHVADWGGELTTEDYGIIGKLIKKAADKNCQGRRFAVLEGGYNHSVLGKNVRAFLEGLD